MDFTKEQQEYIDNLLTEKTKDLYTKDELDRQVTAEVDRRVESGIKKGLETQKAKWEEEFEKKTQMSAEELAKMKIEDRLKSMEERESEINKRSNRIDAREMFASASIPEEDYSQFMDLLVSDDSDVTHENVSQFINRLSITRDNIEKSVKKELSNIPAPKGDEDGPKPKSQVQDFVQMANEANITKL